MTALTEAEKVAKIKRFGFDQPAADMNPDTEKLLAEIDARAKAATPGPWVVDGIEVWTQGESVVGRTIHTTDDGYPRGDYHPTEDADFIAHAREDVPWLVAQLRTALAERDEARQRIDSYRRVVFDPISDYYGEIRERFEAIDRAAITATETSEQ